MLDNIVELVKSANKITIIQAENPDGDSLGSSLALESILINLQKKVSMYCPIEIPKYLRYIRGWDRVVGDFDFTADIAIIVDTAADILLGRVYDIPGARHYLETHPTIVIDHHTSDANISIPHTPLIKEGIATAELIFDLAKYADWNIDAEAADSLMTAVLSDSLGFSVQTVNARTFEIASELTKLGAACSDIEQRRREYMKKEPEILKYKGKLIERIEYFLDNKIAYIHIPFDEIKEYSDKYNPSVLVLDEMRLVNDVEIAIAVKTYPDGKLTGKIRTNIPIAVEVAGFFGGGGHEYASGFRVYESIDKILPEIIEASDKAIKEYYGRKVL